MQDRIYEDGVRKFLDLPQQNGISNAGNTSNTYTQPAGNWKTLLAAGAIAMGLGGGGLWAINSLQKPAETIIKELPGKTTVIEKTNKIKEGVKLKPLIIEPPQ